MRFAVGETDAWFPWGWVFTALCPVLGGAAPNCRLPTTALLGTPGLLRQVWLWVKMWPQEQSATHETRHILDAGVTSNFIGQGAYPEPTDITPQKTAPFLKRFDH